MVELPTSITYDAEADTVYIYLRGKCLPDECVRLASTNDGVVLGFDKDAHLIGIELLSCDFLHPDLVPFAQRLRPAAGEI